MSNNIVCAMCLNPVKETDHLEFTVFKAGRRITAFFDTVYCFSKYTEIAKTWMT